MALERLFQWPPLVEHILYARLFPVTLLFKTYQIPTKEGRIIISALSHGKLLLGWVKEPVHITQAIRGGACLVQTHF